MIKKDFGQKKFWSKKILAQKNLVQNNCGPKTIWVQKEFWCNKNLSEKKVANGSIMRPTATPVLVPKIGGGMTFQTMSKDFPNNVPGYP